MLEKKERRKKDRVNEHTLIDPGDFVSTVGLTGIKFCQYE